MGSTNSDSSLKGDQLVCPLSMFKWILSHDFCVDGPDDHSGVRRLTCSTFPNLLASTVKTDVLDNGLSNKLLRVSCKQPDGNCFKFLVRVYGHQTNSLIDRDLELACMVTVCKMRGSPEVYCKFGNGICYSYVDGVSAVPSDLWHQDYKWLICDEIAHFHSLPLCDLLSRTNSPYNASKDVQLNTRPVAFQRLRDWIQRIPFHLIDDQNDALYRPHFPTPDCLLGEVEFLENALRNATSPVVMCHNDLLPGNIIMSPDKDHVTFIDYEFCGFNHAAADIGNHFCEYAGLDPVDYSRYPSLDYQREWITYYLKRTDYHRARYQDKSQLNNHSLLHYHSKNDANDARSLDEVDQLMKEINYFALVAHLMWGIWAAIRALDGGKDFDFLSYAITRVQEYERMKRIVTSQFPL